MRKGHIVIDLDAEVTVRLPVEFRYKHYSPDQVNGAVGAFVTKLGYREHNWYLEEEETPT